MEESKTTERTEEAQTTPEKPKSEPSGQEKPETEPSGQEEGKQQPVGQQPTEQPAGQQAAAPEESFDALIGGKYRAAFAAKLRGILQRQAQAQRAYLEYQRLRVQEAQAQGEHPQLRLADELDNADFVRLLQSGVSLKTAYEAVHHRDLLEQQAASRLEALRKAAQRPEENALGGGASTRTAVDPGAMSARERRQLRRRAERGERIEF